MSPRDVLPRRWIFSTLLGFLLSWDPFPKLRFLIINQLQSQSISQCNIISKLHLLKYKPKASHHIDKMKRKKRCGRLGHVLV